MKGKKLLITTLVFSFIFISASECDDECNQCKKALEHMYEKIEAQGCNPNTMQKAWDSIDNQCNFANASVGLMAETCYLGFPVLPPCDLPRANMASAGITIYTKIDDQYKSDQNDYKFLFIIQGVLISEELFIDDNISFTADHYISEGENFELVVMMFDEDGESIEVARDSNRFTFVRNGRWESIREIQVTLRGEDTSISFGNW